MSLNTSFYRRILPKYFLKPHLICIYILRIFALYLYATQKSPLKNSVMNKYRFLVLLGFLSSFFCANAQVANYKLQTWQGEFLPQENIGNSVVDLQAFEPYLYNDTYYLVLQFNGYLTQAQQNEFGKNGVELLNYLPNYAYFVAIKRGADLSFLKKNNARAIFGFEPRYKLDVQLTSLPLPDWAVRGGEIAVVFSAYSSVSAKEASAYLAQKGYKVAETESVGYGVVVVLPAADLQKLAAVPFCASLAPVPPVGKPEDREGRSIQRANAIDAAYPMGRHYNGEGVGVALADDGFVGPHIDFKGRITQYTSATGSTHGDGVAGLVGGAGNLLPENRGMADHASLYIYDISNYPHITAAPANLALGIPITTTSYSQGTGGVYDGSATDIDAQVRQYPQLVHCFSAGNAGSGWSTITGGRKAAKNVFAVANLDELDLIEPSSSRGPAQDGRIKPDIATHGQGQTSTDENNTYQVFGGTSAASPSLAGTVAQLYHAYKTLHADTLPQSALIKAVMLNTAQDLGNANVDYTYGYGRLNALRAVETLEQNRYIAKSATQNSLDSITINVPASVRQLKIMTYWHDREGVASANPSLVNNLNTNCKAPNGVSYTPFILSAANPAAVAVSGIDNLNNSEQITINTPAAGIYTVYINGAAVPQGPQKYTITWDFVTDDGVTLTYPIGGERFAPSTTEVIRWDAPTNVGNFALDYALNNGAWVTISNAIAANQRHFSWSVPANISTGNVKMRITRSGISDQTNAPFSIASTPAGLLITKICPDSTTLQWNAINGATGYVLYKLGAKFMDEIDTVYNKTKYTFANLNPNIEDWLAVASLSANGGISPRSQAIRKPIGLLNCVVAIDAALQSVTSPVKGSLSNCNGAITAMPVTINIKNTGLNPITSLTATYTNNGNLVSEQINTTIAPNAIYTHNFATPLAVVANSSYNVAIVVNAAGDGNAFNNRDTIPFTYTLVQAMPYTQNLNVAANFSAAKIDLENPDNTTTWALVGGITNANGSAGKAANVNFFDYNSPGAIDGLLLPIIDLSTATGAVLLFDVAYQQYSASYTDGLKISVSTDCGVTYSPSSYNRTGAALATIAGFSTTKLVPSAASQWKPDTLDLTPYLGNKIRVKFIAVNGYGNDLYIDNFEVKATNAQLATDFSFTSNTCRNATTTFTNTSAAMGVTSWNWNFGAGASPATAATAGPHAVTYASAGAKNISLTIGNAGGGSGTVSKMKTIENAVNPAFSVNRSSLTASFTASSASSDVFAWDFGDGTTSALQNPTHTYAGIGSFLVKLKVSNSCNTDSTQQSVVLPVVGADALQKTPFGLYPNPTRGNFNLVLADNSARILVKITDVTGKTVANYDFENASNAVVNLPSYLANGMYFVHLRLNDAEYRTKIELIK